MALFVSVPVRPNVQPSDLFRDNENFSDMPAKVSDAAIYGIIKQTNLEYEMFRSQICLHATASAYVEERTFACVRNMSSRFLWNMMVINVLFIMRSGRTLPGKHRAGKHIHVIMYGKLTAIYIKSMGTRCLHDN